ncbi:MAG: PfkB family carbohydrate kinase [Acidimicrobiales bacterium]
MSDAALVVCLGDLVEDVVVSPAGPLRRGTDTPAVVQRRRGGSAANVAVNVVAAGGRARFVGAVGDDPAGRQLVAALRAEGVEVAVQRHGRTGSVVVVLDPDGERSFYTDRGACPTLARLPGGALRGAAALHVPAYSLDGEPLAGLTRRTLARTPARPVPQHRRIVGGGAGTPRRGRPRRARRRRVVRQPRRSGVVRAASRGPGWWSTRAARGPR